MTKDGEDPYEGREHSRIKHEFLRKYVERLAIKIGMSGFSTINFVDGFAGPWSSNDGDYSDTSFAIAVETLGNVRGFLRSKGKYVKPRYFLCEKSRGAHAKLASFAESKGAGVVAFRGRFEDNLANIDARIDSQNDFTFTLIDPKGWKVDSAKVFDFLKRQKRGEVLLNFMSDHINRHAGFSEVEQSFGLFLGNPDWTAERDRLPSGWSNERKVLHLMKRRLKQEGLARFCPDMPIEHKDQKRTKMRLVLGTQHPAGVHVFRDVHAKMRDFEVEKKLKRGGDMPLFEAVPSAISGPDFDVSAVGSDAQKRIARGLILRLLPAGTSTTFKELVVRIMEEVAVRPTHVKDVLVDMQQSGDITFQLTGKAKKPNDKTVINGN